MLGENIKLIDRKRIYTGRGCQQTSCDKTDYFKMGKKLFGSRC